jgi:uncharacterized membrane protein YfhO
VDGVKTDFEAFEDAFISVYLTSGSHTIELKYFPDGLIAGVIISILSVLVFIGINIYIKRKGSKNRLR